MQTAVAAIDRPALCLMAAEQALLIQLVLGARSVKLMSAIDDGAHETAGFPTHPAHQLLQRGGQIHRFGN